MCCLNVFKSRWLRVFPRGLQAATKDLRTGYERHKLTVLQATSDETDAPVQEDAVAVFFADEER